MEPKGIQNVTRLSLLLLIAASTLFVWARTWEVAPVVFPDGSDVQLLGVDSYFHLRQAREALDGPPYIERRDSLSHFPGVAYQNVSGLFSTGTALLSPVGGLFFPGRDPVASTAAVIPLLLGLGTLWAVFGLGWIMGGPVVAGLAAVFHVLHPGTSLGRTTLGFADQHALESFLVMAAALGLAWSLRQTAGASFRPGWRTLLVGSPLWLLFLSWVGAPMYIAVFAAAAAAALIVSIPLGSSRLVGRTLTVFFLMPGLGILATAWLWPDALLELNGNIRWWSAGGWLAMAAGCWGVGWTLDRLQQRGLTDRSLVLGTLGLSILVPVLFFRFHPAGPGFWSWLTFARGDDVSEQTRLPVLALWGIFGVTGLLAAIWPLVVPLRKRLPRPESALVLIAGSILFLIWWTTHDFDYMPPAFVALMGGWTFHSVSVDRLAKFAPEKIMTAAVVVVLATIPFTGTRHVAREAALDGIVTGSPWMEAARWLQTPEGQPFPGSSLPDSDPASAMRHPRGTDGAITAWDFGNFVAAAGVPVRASRYPSAATARWATAASEAEAMDLLCPGCSPPDRIRYALIDGRMATNFFHGHYRVRSDSIGLDYVGEWTVNGRRIPRVHYGTDYDRALANRLHRSPTNGFRHHRLVFQSTESRIGYYRLDPATGQMLLRSALIGRDMPVDMARRLVENDVFPLGSAFAYDAYVAPAVRVFEVVAGAVIEGRHTPGDTLSIHLDLLDQSTQQRLAYFQHSEVDPTGRVHFTVPYATTGIAPRTTVRPLRGYRIRTSDGVTLRSDIEVSESSIAHGDTLRLDPASLR